jgi:8-oxo-dGTP diphosphatase
MGASEACLYAAVRAHVVRSGMVLLGRRAKPDRRWTTFGGRPESGESPEETLRREVREELGVEALRLERLPDRESTREGESRPVAVFVIREWQGEPENRATHEHSAIAWFGRDALASLPMDDRARAEAMELLAQAEEEPR